MILDSLTHISRYFGLDPRFQRGLKALQEFTTASVIDQRIDLLPDGALFVRVQRCDTKPANERQFESHRRYADIQYLISGGEVMLWHPTDRLVVTLPYQPERDLALYAMTEPAMRLQVSPGQFAIFFPTDGHAPGISVGLDAVVLKVVVKVRLD